MATVFFPSCKVKAAYPETSQKLNAYLSARFELPITGCCRENLQNLTESDTAVYICNTCAAFCDESSKAREVVSVWELLAQDEEFPFPDYEGEEIVLQDCWRTCDKRSAQDALRELMGKMNIRVVELPARFEKTRFCGRSILVEAPAYYREFAPKRFFQDAPDSAFIPHTAEEHLTLLQDHCAGITTDRAACYCTGCADGLAHGGKRPVHVMELLFPPAQ